ncbi:hypothetical protein TELCIR_26067, partial [Teladorsagia circumcincta]
SSVDPPEKDIPICTLKNFPNEIQHTIQWARDLFEGLFTAPAETANQFLTDERTFLERLEQMNVSQRTQLLAQVKDALIDSKPASAEDCVKWARMLFQIAKSVQPPPFKPRAGVKIAVTEAEAKENADTDDANAEAMLEQLKVKLARLHTKTIPKLKPIDFEK